jgi:hypothetical protein
VCTYFLGVWLGRTSILLGNVREGIRNKSTTS